MASVNVSGTQGFSVNEARSILNSNGAAAMYRYMTANGYKYSTLALGVVLDQGLAGQAGTNHLNSVADQNGVPVNLQDIYGSMANEYLNVLERRGLEQGDVTATEAWEFHSRVFDQYGLPPEAWVMNTPFSVLDDTSRDILWRDALDAAGSPGKEAAFSFKVESMLLNMSGLPGAPDEQFILDLARNLNPSFDELSPSLREAAGLWAVRNSASRENLRNLIDVAGDGAKDFVESLKKGLTTNGLFDLLNFIFPTNSGGDGGDGGEGGEGSGSSAAGGWGGWGDFIRTLSTLFNLAINTSSPLVLDLDGDGVETLSLSAGVKFDLDKNGIAERTGWVASDDGLLVLDRNQNGKVDDGGELFGNYTGLAGGQAAENGFVALSDLDENKDGIINSADSMFSKLQVWRDLNSDGQVSAGELFSLQALGVTGLSTNFQSSTAVDSNGNGLFQQGSFETAGGNGALVDVWFATEDKTLNLDFHKLGKLPSLKDAIKQDGSGRLSALVEMFKAEPDVLKARALIDEMVFIWSGVIDASPDSRGAYIDDSRKLLAIEAVLGRNYVQGSGLNSGLPDPGPNASAKLLKAYEALADFVYSGLAINTKYSAWLASAEINLVGGELVFDVDSLVAAMKSVYQNSAEEGMAAFGDFGRVLSALGQGWTSKLINAVRAKGDLAGSGAEYLLANFGSQMGSSLGEEIFGAEVGETILGLGGNDKIFGAGGADSIEGGAGDDFLSGDAGNDTYKFSKGWGQDIVSNYDIGANRVDVVEFKSDVAASDIQLRRVGSDLLVTSKSSSDSIKVANFFFSKNYEIQEIRFSDGTAWNVDRIKELVMVSTESADEIHGYANDDVIDGGAGGDKIYGGGGSDTLIGGSGNDILDGENGSDTYRFSRGWGNDVINNYDTTTGHVDTVEFGAGITAADIKLSRVGPDLWISLLGGTDSIRVTQYFYSTQYEVQQIRFADGTIWSGEQIKSQVLVSTDGADEIHGYATADTIGGGAGADKLFGEGGNDILIGGNGNDTLDGGSGSDTYLFARGWGNDVISNYESATGRTDTIEFDADIKPADIQLTHVGSDLWIALKGSTDTIKVSMFFYSPQYEVQQIRFADGTTWSLEQIKSQVLISTDGADEIHGYATADTISGGAGADKLFGEGGNDILIGGNGNDTLDGGSGSDTYLFARGWGKDVISNYESATGRTDTIEFDADITPADIQLTHVGSDLWIVLKGSTDTIKVSMFFYSPQYEVQQIRFADGTTWSLEQIKSQVLISTDGADEIHGYATADTISGGAGADKLYGEGGNDILIGGAGNDTLDGGSGSDTYLFARGWGKDVISNYESATGRTDTIEFDADIMPADIQLTHVGSDLWIALKGSTDTIKVSMFFYSSQYEVQQIRFADGTTWSLEQIKSQVLISTDGADEIHGYATADTISGGAGADKLYGEGGNDILIGGTGNDTLDGGSGSDTYLFARGWGKDVISNYESATGRTDTIEFDADITPADIQLTHVGSDLWIALKGSTDTIKVSMFFYSSQYEVQQIRFADGTTWSLEQIKAIVMGATMGNDEIHGYASDDVIYALSGNDRVFGEGGNDTLIGGAGNDTLDGGSGSDIYRFARGWGSDVVSNYEAATGRTDTIEFDEGITPADIQLTHVGSDLWIALKGSTDTIKVSMFFYSSQYEVQQIRFADGTTWSLEQIKSQVLISTDGADEIHGYATADTIGGGAGADKLYGEGGNDILIGGTGNDTLDGGSGSDTYLFARGWGNDVISNYEAATGRTDTIEFEAGITPADIQLNRIGTDLWVTLKGTTDSIKVSMNFYSSQYELQQIRFADGTVWGLEQIKSLVMISTDGADEIHGYATADTVSGGAGADKLYGEGGNDILIGDTGNDILDGGYGSDTYLFARGWGNDTISNYDTTISRVDAIEFQAGISPADVKLTRSGNNLVVALTGSTDSITVSMFFISPTYEIQAIRFASGETWTLEQIKAFVMGATTGNDEIHGYATDDVIYALSGNDKVFGEGGNDTLVGGAGNDTLDGGTGSDTYLFARGWGKDVISNYEAATGRTDTIEFEAGITPADIQLNRIDTDLWVTLKGSTDSIKVSMNFYSSQYELQQIRFADGTVWGLEQIKSLVMISTDGADEIHGYATADTVSGGAGADKLYGEGGNDVLIGGAGNDILDGGNGSDTYLFARGWGKDVISNYEAATGRTDTIEFEAGITPADIQLNRIETDLWVTLKGSTDSIKVSMNFYSSQYELQQIRFADGTVWGLEQIKSLVMISTDGADEIHGYATADTVSGGAGADKLYGEGGNDVLIGGTGNDTLTGGSGSDTYLFARGWGKDVISNYEAATGRTDTIEFEAGITPADIQLNRIDTDLWVNLKGSADSIKVSMNFYSSQYELQQIRFADGTVWGLEQIKSLVMISTDGADEIHGYATADTVSGGAGADKLFGEGGNDVLIGGTGNDTLNGGGGSDTYLFSGGWGNDTISNYDTTANRIDTIEFESGITSADIQLSRTGSDLLIKAGVDTIKVAMHFYSSQYEVQQIRFSDGTTWGSEQIKNQVLIGAQQSFTSVEASRYALFEGGLSPNSIEAMTLDNLGAHNDRGYESLQLSSVFEGMENHVLEAEKPPVADTISHESQLNGLIDAMASFGASSAIGVSFEVDKKSLIDTVLVANATG